MRVKRHWFYHYCDARHDPKLAYIIRTHGMEGYGQWWVLIEVLRNSDDFCIIKKKFNLAALASQMNLDDAGLERFLFDLADCELIKDDGTRITCPTLDRLMEEYSRRSEQMAEMNKIKFGDRTKRDKIINDLPEPAEHDIPAVSAPRLAGAPSGYPQFEKDVINSWNTVACRRTNLPPVTNVSQKLRDRLIERFKEPKFVGNYERIMRHIEENQYFHGKNKSAFVLTLARLVDGERSYSNIIEQIGDCREEKSFGGSCALVGETIKDALAGSGIQIPPR